MEPNRLSELAAINAIGALDGDDAKELARLLAERDPVVEREVAAYNDLAGWMAAASPSARAPRPELKQLILQRIQAAEIKVPEATAVPPSAAPPGGLSFLRQAHASGWQKVRVPGASFRLLHLDQTRGYALALGRLEAGAAYPAHPHSGPEDIYVLSGDLHIGDEVLHAGDFHHAEAGSAHATNSSENGCMILIQLSAEDLVKQLASGG